MTASAAEDNIIYITIYDAEDEVVKENLENQSLEEVLANKDCASIGVIAIKSPEKTIKRYLPIGRSTYEYRDHTILLFYDFTPEQLQMNYMSIIKAFPELPIGHCWGTPDIISGLYAINIAIERAR